MTTHAVRPVPAWRDLSPASATWRTHALWLAGGMLVGFLVPFILADTLDLNRDLFYGIYGLAVFGYVGLWARMTKQPLRSMVVRRWRLALALAVASSVILVVMVYGTEEATSRPSGFTFGAALLWRGVVYGFVDGVLLSVFPILVVFAAFAGTGLTDRLRGKLAVGAVALVASLAMTAAYHAGYSEFRGESVRKPLAGDVVWSAPTLLTLNPIGAPIAHVALHSAAVVHSYDTETFLPPHSAER
jgi:hypothetical protein